MKIKFVDKIVIIVAEFLLSLEALEWTHGAIQTVATNRPEPIHTKRRAPCSVCVCVRWNETQSKQQLIDNNEEERRLRAMWWARVDQTTHWQTWRARATHPTTTSATHDWHERASTQTPRSLSLSLCVTLTGNKSMSFNERVNAACFSPVSVNRNEIFTYTSYTYNFLTIKTRQNTSKYRLTRCHTCQLRQFIGKSTCICGWMRANQRCQNMLLQQTQNQKIYKKKLNKNPICGIYSCLIEKRHPWIARNDTYWQHIITIVVHRETAIVKAL